MVYSFISINVYIYICAFNYIYIHLNIYIYVHAHAHTHAHTYIYIYTHMRGMISCVHDTHRILFEASALSPAYGPGPGGAVTSVQSWSPH